MQIDTTSTDLAGGQENIRLTQTPDFCPRCHRSVHPKLVSVAMLLEVKKVQAVFRCTHQKCQELFFGTYSPYGSGGGRTIWTLNSVSPIAAQQATFPETVSSVSPVFVQIFNQAMAAEAANLDQLVGIGMRKALEFLVKDFAVSEHVGKEAEIRNANLGTCIAQYVSDPNIKECARRAAWLGNDETHYTRKWETKDVSDLKLLVRLTVNWIDNSLLTKKYIAEMGAGGAA